MKQLKERGVTWFLSDETLIPFVTALPEETSSRRSHHVIGIGGRTIFVKSFVEKGVTGALRNIFASRGKKEFEAGRLLAQAKIPTATPLGYGIGEGRSYVLQGYIDGQHFLDALQETKSRSALLASLAHLLRTLAAHHIRHNDLHLENILVAGGLLHLIDLHSMTRKRSFTVGDEISNLTHALAMAYRQMSRDERLFFFHAYGKTELQRPFETNLSGLDARWVAAKKKRAFNTTSRLEVRGNDILFRGAGRDKGEWTETIKDDRKVRLERYTTHVRKSYRDFRRLKRAWQNHVVLAYMELAVIPQAYWMTKPSRGRWGFVAMEDLKGRGEELDRYLDDTYDSLNQRERRSLVDRLAAFLIGLFDMAVTPRDLKGCNIFSKKDGTFMLLDVEDIQFRRVSDREARRMLVQLNTTLPARITAEDRIRFFLRLAPSLGVERGVQKRSLLRAIASASARETIVYEGRGGLKTESWHLS